MPINRIDWASRDRMPSGVEISATESPCPEHPPIDVATRTFVSVRGDILLLRHGMAEYPSHRGWWLLHWDEASNIVNSSRRLLPRLSRSALSIVMFPTDRTSRNRKMQCKITHVVLRRSVGSSLASLESRISRISCIRASRPERQACRGRIGPGRTGWIGTA